MNSCSEQVLRQRKYFMKSFKKLGDKIHVTLILLAGMNKFEFPRNSQR